jgi:Transposase DDE domain group 1
MSSSRVVSRVRVRFDDARLVDHGGLFLTASLGERLGLSGLFDERVRLGVPSVGANVAAKSLTVVHSLLAGGDCIDDVDALRAGGSAGVLGHGVAAPSTVGSFLRAFSPGHVGQLDSVGAELLRRAWSCEAARAVTVIDVDSTLCETFGLGKDGARQVMRTGRRGYHPLLAIEAGTGDVVHARLRRGRSNDGSGAARFITHTLNRARRAGATAVTVRADSGFYQADVIAACRRSGASFSVGARIRGEMRTVIEQLPDEAWTPIDYPYGDGAAVAELDWVAFDQYRHGRRSGVPVRLIVRRVPPSPGLQQALFPVFSYHPFITDLAGDIVELDAFHRRHAEIENIIKDLKMGMGMNHFPSRRWGANGAWLAFNVIAHNLARWTARLGLADGTIRTKTFRRRHLGTPGRLTRSARRITLHFPARWPWATQFLTALDRIHNLPLIT